MLLLNRRIVTSSSVADLPSNGEKSAIISEAIEIATNKIQYPDYDSSNYVRVSSPNSIVDATAFEAEVCRRLKKVFPLYYKNVDEEECDGNAKLVASMVGFGSNDVKSINLNLFERQFGTDKIYLIMLVLI